MKEYARVALILFLICAVSAGILGYINGITAPVISENSRIETENAFIAIAGGYDFDVNEQREGDGGSIKYAIPLKSGNAIKGYILGLGGKGYGGDFIVVASFASDGSVISAKMMANSETSGLGKKSEESWYMKMFEGLGGEKPLPASKSDLENPSLVSGASVTFNGVSKALRSGSEYVRNLGGK